MTPKNKKKSRGPGQKAKSPESLKGCVQKAPPSKNESSSSSTKTLEAHESKIITEEMTEPSSEAPSSQQTNGGTALPAAPPTAKSDSEIDSDEEDDDYEDNDEDDDDDDEEEDDDEDDEYNMYSAEWKAKSRDRTRKFVLEFLDTTKSKHLVDMKIRPLVGEKDYTSWLFAMETNLRMHQVWEVVEGDLTMLVSTDDLYPDLMRMNDVACAVIYANISQQVRDCPCVFGSLRYRDPGILMNAINEHFGPDSEGIGGQHH
ncbi:uncharacterized protein N7503_003374 [Penicillium pulvis]|uniref:uncharacterized protein n=1 Tax=Penicillium pulvis TaxID=1562058 RepID=UPI002547F196|nr:uncharacterized protein N7503_003374 [Penicillium pulvis]KAJ5805772.1 hypothetical protein N7503_003374 [Penicillium pulvis]